jgi:Mycothiol maleylpyruvate isomerase N-terminal domain
VSAGATFSKSTLFREEEEAWISFHGLLVAVPDEELMDPGTYEEWSAKDILAHVGSWHAEAATVLEQLRLGTYRGWDGDDRVEVLNRRWWEAWREQDPHAVLAHLHASRFRMLEELDLLPDALLDDTAIGWFRESGVDHYGEHRDALRAWGR